MQITKWLPLRNWLLIALPVVAIGTAAAVAFSALGNLAAEVDLRDKSFAERTVAAAVNALVHRMAETHSEYAIWDDAVRNLYGSVSADFVEENFASSTAAGTLFDTAFLLDESGSLAFGYHGGDRVRLSPGDLFGAGFGALQLQLSTAGVAAALLRTPWGVQVVAVGPVLPNTDAVEAPDPPRLLVVAKTLDAALVDHLARDYVIEGLTLQSIPPAAGYPLSDPRGSIVGWLTWKPATAGAQAEDKIAGALLFAFTLLALGTAAFSLVAVVSLRRSDRLSADLIARQQRLEGALAGVPNGICMFDADKRLLMCNRRYAEMYDLPERLTKPGTHLQQIFEYRRARGNAPANFPNYVSHAGVDWTAGGTKVFEFSLDDGRIIRISHLNLEGGSYVATHEDITTTVEAERLLAEAAMHDPQTRLPNRSSFYASLDRTIATRFRPLAVLAIDIDNFNAVNDTLGNSRGDLLIAMIAERLKPLVTRDDILARIGGDSFAVMSNDQRQPEAASRLAGRIREELAKPFAVEGSEVTLTASIGIALSPAHGSTGGAIMRNAETALVWVKEHGRNSYQFFDPAMDDEGQSRRRLLKGLRSALDNDEFEIHYQPFVDIKTGATTGYEALLRWQHPELGDIPPSVFIPIAEEEGLIVAIGDWVLRRACSDAVKWPYSYYVAVNLSSAQFQRDDLGATVFSALAASGLSATRLEVEITETVLLANEARVRAILHQLRQAGIRIAMDDFGTGYSSLKYLRAFPFDKIKIDQSFVRDLPTSSESKAIIRAVTGLAKEFGLAVVGEGIEMQSQADFLAANGCSEGQGFLFGRPQVMPANASGGSREESESDEVMRKWST